MKSNASRPAILLSAILLKWRLIIVFVVFHFMRTSHKGDQGSTTSFAITPDNKFIIDFAYTFPFSQLMIMEIETGEYKLYDLDGATTCKLMYDEIISRYYIITNKRIENPETYYVDLYSFEYPYHELELQKTPIPNRKNISNIDYNMGKFAIKGHKNVISIYDMQTGGEEQINCEEYWVIHDLKWSKNGQYIALVESHVVHIFDVSTKIRIKSYDVDYGCFAEFYDSDTKLLIGTWEKGYCIDINSIL